MVGRSGVMMDSEIVRLMIKDGSALGRVAAEDHGARPEGRRRLRRRSSRESLRQSRIDACQKLATNHAEFVEDEEPRATQRRLQGVEPVRVLEHAPTPRAAPVDEPVNRAGAEAQLERGGTGRRCHAHERRLDASNL